MIIKPKFLISSLVSMVTMVWPDYHLGSQKFACAVSTYQTFKILTLILCWVYSPVVFKNNFNLVIRLW